MRFRTSDGYTLQRIAQRSYPRVLRTDRDLTFQDYLGWPVADSGEKLDGEFLPKTSCNAWVRNPSPGADWFIRCTLGHHEREAPYARSAIFEFELAAPTDQDVEHCAIAHNADALRCPQFRPQV